MSSTNRDHLSGLPSELIHMVLGYLLADHEPERIIKEATSSDNEPNNSKGAHHSLDHVAATCKKLRSDTMAFCHHFLTQHSIITKYKPLRSAKLEAKRNLLRSSRNGGVALLSWMEKDCVFCGRKSVRKAILMNGLNCCKKCDREQWPEKITKTDARAEYYLTDEHLLPHSNSNSSSSSSSSSNTGISPKKLEDHARRVFPQIRYGVYFTSNVPTTMFLRKDVEWLAGFLHGDFRAYAAKRQAEREARRQKIKANIAKRDQEARSRVIVLD